MAARAARWYAASDSCPLAGKLVDEEGLKMEGKCDLCYGPGAGETQEDRSCHD